jgi:tetratricopeptide (TPR) repeat protein
LVLTPIFPNIVIETEYKKVENVKKIEKEEIVSNTKEITKNSQNENRTPPPPPAVKIIVQTKQKTLLDYIQNFQQLPTYDTAIQISKLYLKNSEYNKSIEWAKKANNINPENYESWYIFAKSLVKLGKRKKAKQILKAYIESYGNNSEITNLLRSLK